MNICVPGGRVTSTDISKQSGQVSFSVPSPSRWLGCEKCGLASWIGAEHGWPVSSAQQGAVRTSFRRVTNRFLLITA